MLPAEVDVPRAEDFCQHKLIDKGKRSSFMWMVYLFKKADDFEIKKVMKLWHKNATKVGIPLKRSTSIKMRNDDPGTDLDQLALCFEKMLRDLGYDVK